MADQQQDSQSTSSSAQSGQSVNVQQIKSQLANKFQANKSLVLKLHSILTWEQDTYPVVLAAFVTFSFLIIHFLNSSVLTTLSYLGITGALLDLAMPTIARNLCGGSSSQVKLGEKESQRFDKICLDLAKLYAFFRGSCNACCSLKTSKPKLYYPALLGVLLMLAYVGNKINNLFLTYCVTLLLVMYPGLDKRGIPQKAIQFVFLKLGRTPPAFAMTAPVVSDRRGSGKRN